MITTDERQVIMKSSSIHVIGLGRVGLITLFHLSKKGFHPVGVDINKELVESLKKGKVPFFETNFRAALNKYKSHIKFQTSFRNGKYWFICIPTPFDSSIKKMNLSNLKSLLRQIDKTSGKNFVFIRSTLIPGSSLKFEKQFKNSVFSYFPEFFREGCFFKDYKSRKFSILGSRDKGILKHFIPFGFSKITEFCSPEEAELVKIISNLFHGLKVSFANEVGRVSTLFKARPDKVMELFLKDKDLNISAKYLNPGFSYGGPCLSKDIQSLQSFSGASENFLPQYVEKSNHIHIDWVAKQILSLRPKKISLLGCCFKGDRTSDYRNSAVLKLAKILTKKVKVFGIEEELKNCGVHIFSEKSIEKLLLSDVFVLGAINLFSIKKGLFKTYKGQIFDLLIENLPEEIKSHKNYRTAFTHGFRNSVHHFDVKKGFR